MASSNDARVEQDDLQLMAMMGMQRGYAKLSLRDLQKSLAAVTDSAGRHEMDDTLSTSFRQHLYAKYVQPRPKASDAKRAASKKPAP